MKTTYKYIHFLKIEDKPKTSVWICLNNRDGGLLGYVKWQPTWRQYCYLTDSFASYSVGCLEDINHFIGQLEKERKQKK